MTTPAVLDDYLQDLLGDVGISPAPAAEAPPAVVAVEPLTAPVAEAKAKAKADEASVITPDVPLVTAPAPVLAVAPIRAGAEADLITDDEFEALLDQLHGDGVPQASAAPAATPVQTPAPALAIAPSRAPAGEAISDDEFEALLDELHGGSAPTARVPSPAPVAEPPSAPIAHVAPAMPRALPPLPTHPYLQTPVDSGQRRRATERKTRWLRLRCDQQHYALELLKVQEVVLPATLLPLRGAAPHMLGVMNLRVSAVEDVANLSDHQIESPDNARVGRIANPLFRGVARLNERAVILLDASQLLT